MQQRSTDFGLIVLDISDPENPVELSRLFEPGWNGVHNLFLHRDRAYLAHAGSLGMSIVDLTDPRAPVVSGFWLHQHGFSNVVHDVFIQDDLAFISDIASDSGGLVILDLQDPDNPLTLSSLPFAEGLHSAWAVGIYVYCTRNSAVGNAVFTSSTLQTPDSLKSCTPSASDHPLPTRLSARTIR